MTFSPHNFYRRGNGSFNRPSDANPVSDYVGGDAHVPLPFGNGHGSAVECQEPIAPTVVVLHRSGFPAAIARTIASVVVYSVNRMIGGWPWSHIGVKQAKVTPAIAYDYPPATIIFPSWIGLFLASIFHVGPNLVFRCFAKAMSRESGRRQFIFKTTTRFDVTARQIDCAHMRRRPTVAQTIPKITSRTIFLNSLTGKTMNNKPGKSVPVNVPKALVGRQRAWNDWGRFDVLSHIVFSRGRFLTGESAFAL